MYFLSFEINLRCVILKLEYFNVIPISILDQLKYDPDPKSETCWKLMPPKCFGRNSVANNSLKLSSNLPILIFYGTTNIVKMTPPKSNIVKSSEKKRLRPAPKAASAQCFLKVIKYIPQIHEISSARVENIANNQKKHENYSKHTWTWHLRNQMISKSETKTSASCTKGFVRSMLLKFIKYIPKIPEMS